MQVLGLSLDESRQLFSWEQVDQVDGPHRSHEAAEVTFECFRRYVCTRTGSCPWMTPISRAPGLRSLSRRSAFPALPAGRGNRLRDPDADWLPLQPYPPLMPPHPFPAPEDRVLQRWPPVRGLPSLAVAVNPGLVWNLNKLAGPQASQRFPLVAEKSEAPTPLVSILVPIFKNRLRRIRSLR